jgi:hypothetical protein
VLVPDAPAVGPAAVAMWLFDDASETLPGGYEQNELSLRSPATSLKSFPQDLVLVARASVLIKGIAATLGLRWSLAQEWAAIGEAALKVDPREVTGNDNRVRFRSILGLGRSWLKAKTRAALFRLSGGRRRNKALQKRSMVQ